MEGGQGEQGGEKDDNPGQGEVGAPSEGPSGIHKGLGIRPAYTLAISSLFTSFWLYFTVVIISHLLVVSFLLFQLPIVFICGLPTVLMVDLCIVGICLFTIWTIELPVVVITYLPPVLLFDKYSYMSPRLPPRVSNVENEGDVKEEEAEMEPFGDKDDPGQEAIADRVPVEEGAAEVEGCLEVVDRVGEEEGEGQEELDTGAEEELEEEEAEGM